jgi:hypothetical protein
MKMHLSMDDVPEARTFVLIGERYIRYQMSHAVRDDLLVCMATPTYVLEAKYSPTGSDIATNVLGLAPDRAKERSLTAAQLSSSM